MPSATYDPASERVRSLRFDNFGPAKAAPPVVIEKVELDPTLLDSSHLTARNARAEDSCAFET